MLSLCILIALALVFVALYFWSRRVEREVDFDSMESDQTDEHRRAMQIGIGLASSQGINNGM